jgi:hypothetical protein
MWVEEQLHAFLASEITKVTEFYSLLNRTEGDKWYYTEWAQGFPELKLILTHSRWARNTFGTHAGQG